MIIFLVWWLIKVTRFCHLTSKLSIIKRVRSPWRNAETSFLLTSNVGSQLCESTFLPTPPSPFPTHPTEVLCGNFPSIGIIGRNLEGNFRQKGNSDMCLFSPFAAVCSALEKIPTEGGFFIQIFLTSLSRLVHRIISPPVDKGIDWNLPTTGKRFRNKLSY